jgi:hypothetical protein
MPQKLKPIDEVIANPPPVSRGKQREADPHKIDAKPSPQPPPKEKR